jgi:Uma2 family endonuclease
MRVAISLASSRLLLKNQVRMPARMLRKPRKTVLMVRVLSPGEKNEQRDKQLKLKLYSQQGVQEYWVVDTNLRQVQVYRRDNAVLALVMTLQDSDALTSPLLPNFTYPLSRIFGRVR